MRILIKHIIKSNLGISDNVEFERVHRMPQNGSNTSRYPRTIVAKFSRFKDRETVRTNSKYLKGTHIGIHEQFGKSVNDRRKILWPKYKQARKDGHYARVVYDALIIDNQRFKVSHDRTIVCDNSYDRPPPQRHVQGNNNSGNVRNNFVSNDSRRSYQHPR